MSREEEKKFKFSNELVPVKKVEIVKQEGGEVSKSVVTSSVAPAKVGMTDAQYLVYIGAVQCCTIRNLALDGNGISRCLYDTGSETVLEDMQIAYSSQHGLANLGSLCRYSNIVVDYNTEYAYGCGFVVSGTNGLFLGCVSVSNNLYGFYVLGAGNTFIGCKDTFDAVGFFVDGGAANTYVQNCWNYSTYVQSYP